MRLNLPKIKSFLLQFTDKAKVYKHKEEYNIMTDAPDLAKELAELKTKQLQTETELAKVKAENELLKKPAKVDNTASDTWKQVKYYRE